MEAALDRLQKERIIEAVSYSEWAAPVVPIVEKDGTIRLCGDYKVTVNRVIEPDSYPLPQIEDLFACLTARGGNLLKTGSPAGVLAARDGGRVESVPHHQHTQGPFPLQPVALWGFVSSSYIPADHGINPG